MQATGRGELRVRAALPFPGPRQEARRPEARRPEARPIRFRARRPPPQPPRTPAGPRALLRAWAGEGRRRDVPIAGVSAASASPEEGGGIFLAFKALALPLAGGGTRGKVNQAVSGIRGVEIPSFILPLRLYEGTKYMVSFSVANPVDKMYTCF